MTIPVLRKFVVGPIGGDKVAVGIAFGAFSVTALVLRPLAGGYSDRHGRRPLIVGGAALFATGDGDLELRGGKVRRAKMHHLYGQVEREADPRALAICKLPEAPSRDRVGHRGAGDGVSTAGAGRRGTPTRPAARSRSRVGVRATGAGARPARRRTPPRRRDRAGVRTPRAPDPVPPVPPPPSPGRLPRPGASGWRGPPAAPWSCITDAGEGAIAQRRMTSCATGPRNKHIRVCRITCAQPPYRALDARAPGMTGALREPLFYLVASG